MTDEIVGVSREGFTAAKPGDNGDIFMPTMMNSEGHQQQQLVLVPHMAPPNTRHLKTPVFVAIIRSHYTFQPGGCKDLAASTRQGKAGAVRQRAAFLGRSRCSV